MSCVSSHSYAYVVLAVKLNSFTDVRVCVSLHGADFLQDALLSHQDHDAELFLRCLPFLMITFRLFGISVLLEASIYIPGDVSSIMSANNS